MPGCPCANLSTEQAQRVQHTFPQSTVSALLLLPSSHKLTQERQATQSRAHTKMCAFHRWGQVELTIRAERPEESCRTAAQASVSDTNRLQFTRLCGLRFTMPRLGRNAHKDTVGQMVPRFDRFYASVAHSHKNICLPFHKPKGWFSKDIGAGQQHPWLAFRSCPKLWVVW